MYIKKIETKIVDLVNDKNIMKRSKMLENNAKICSGRNDENR